MSPDEWREVDVLVQAAFERAPEERAAFLSEACAGRPELRREVSTLLEADAAADAFLDQPPPFDPAGFDSERAYPRAESKPRPGARFGSYQLFDEIGYGGFCRVYRARNTEQDFRRLVAIKVVDPGLDYGFGDDSGGDIAQRFRLERQILAQLEHPSIARLFDGGEVDGRSYFVMEYVDGRPIDVYCDRQRLDLDARLRLMLRVIEAVAYAHDHLIVHRDLKPGNLLVTADGRPKLLDFGIAKVLEPEALALSFDATRSGLRPMTPAWAAPEQVRGEPVTTATDVYGLGLLLYFLLTGARAYALDEKTPAQMERTICELEPMLPSRRVAEQRASERPPGATPARLEGDLDAVLLKALAKDPRRRYSTVRHLAADLERYLRDEPVAARPATWLYRGGKWLRRHRLTALAALLAVLVLAGFVTALVHQASRLRAERDLARLEATRADEVRGFLVDLFAEADPGRTQGRDLSVRRILAEGEAKIERLEEPAARTELLTTLGSVHAGLGQVPEGAELLRRARDEAVALYGAEHPRVAEIDHRLGTILLESDRFDAAEAAIGRALELRRRVLGEVHPQTATSRALYGRLRLFQGFWAEAEKILETAVDQLEAATRDAEVRSARVRALGLPPASLEAGESQAAEKAALDFLGDLAEAREQLGHDPQAMLEERLERVRETLGARHPLVADTLFRLALAKPDREARLTQLEAARALQDDIYGSDHPEQAHVLREMAFVLLHLDPERGLEVLEQAFAIDNRVWGHGTWALSLDHGGFARLYERLGETSKADAHWKLAIEHARLGTPSTHPWRVNTLVGRIRFLLSVERAGDASRETARLEEASRLLDEMMPLRSALAHRNEQWDAMPLIFRALVDLGLERDVTTAAEHLRRHAPAVLERLPENHLLARRIRAELDALSS